MPAPSWPGASWKVLVLESGPLEIPPGMVLVSPHRSAVCRDPQPSSAMTCGKKSLPVHPQHATCQDMLHSWKIYQYLIEPIGPLF